MVPKRRSPVKSHGGVPLGAMLRKLLKWKLVLLAVLGVALAVRRWSRDAAVGSPDHWPPVPKKATG